jgi:SAM-dependent methyltransferase
MFGWYKVKKFYPPRAEVLEPWDRQYEADGEQWSDPEEYRRQLFYPLLTKYLEPGKKYLDAGCGLGGWLAFLRARGYDVVGLEASKRAVAMIAKLNPTLPIQQGDARRLPFDNTSLDGYLAIGTWEYLEDATEAVAAEAARVLKPGGVLILEVPYSNPLRRWTYLPLKTLQVFIREKLLGQRATFAHHMFRKGDLREVLTTHGFEILEENPHDLPGEASHYGLWVDWPMLRGERPYELNGLGRAVKNAMNSLSPWMIATGIFFVAKKK